METADSMVHHVSQSIMLDLQKPRSSSVVLSLNLTACTSARISFVDVLEL